MTAPLSLPVDTWPQQDQQLWSDLRTRRRYGRVHSEARRWSERRCRIVTQGYGQWLAYLLKIGELDPDERPEVRATCARIEAFVRQLRRRVSSTSVAMMTQGLQRMLAVMAPHHDWRWLDSVVANLKALSTTSRDKHAHMVDPRDIYALAIDLMEEARRTANRFHSAAKARDGLMIAVLINCPVRIANLTMIEIGQHLRRSPDSYWLHFDEVETKTGASYEADLPPELTPWIEQYLTVHRPKLLARCNGYSTDRLWINRWGKTTSEKCARVQINKRTRDAFGRHIWPHLFRSIAATGFVDHAPEKVGLVSYLLGHGNTKTAREHYILSQGATAHKAVQSALEERRKAAAARLKKGGR